DATAAVVNTNLAAAVAMMTWIVMDMIGGPGKKATFLGGLNGMICGLVGITPAAGYVTGVGAIIIGFVTSAIVWFAWNYLSKVRPFSKVDDALGVVYTHGIAGLLGGLLVGLLADPSMIVYLGIGKSPNVTTAGLFHGHPRQLLVQAGAALTIIVWDALITFLILRGIGLFMKLRIPDAELEVGDVAVHGEEAYPAEELVRVGAPANGPRSALPRENAATADKVSHTEPCRPRPAACSCHLVQAAGRTAAGHADDGAGGGVPAPWVRRAAMPSSRQSRPNSNRSSLVSAASGSMPSVIIATRCGNCPAP